MANFAILDDNDQVIDILNIDNTILLDPLDNVEKEINGINHILSLNPNLKKENIIQTSFNMNFRGVFAEIGLYYIRSENSFAKFKNPLYPSWKLNKFYGRWMPPKIMPDKDPNLIQWDENKKEWVDIDKKQRYSI